MIFFCPLSCFFSGVYTQGFVVVLTPNINDLNNQWPPFLLTTAHRLKTTQQHSATFIKKNSPIAPNLEVQLKQLKVFSGFAMNDDLHVPLNQLHPKKRTEFQLHPTSAWQNGGDVFNKKTNSEGHVMYQSLKASSEERFVCPANDDESQLFLGIKYIKQIDARFSATCWNSRRSVCIAYWI